MNVSRVRPSRRSVRLPEFDSSKIGMYFVTICSAERKCIFSEIRGNSPILSPVGDAVKTFWAQIPQHFPNVKMDAYVVMPNHLHGILTIESKSPHAAHGGGDAPRVESFGKPTQGSVPTIVRSFKAAVSNHVRESRLAAGEPIWQRGYFEHVLRNTQEFVEATNYILQNPVRWVDDEENLNGKLDAAP